MRVNTIIFDAANFTSMSELNEAFAKITCEQTVRLRGEFNFCIGEALHTGNSSERKGLKTHGGCVNISTARLNIEASEAVINLTVYDVPTVCVPLLYIDKSAAGATITGLSLNVIYRGQASNSAFAAIYNCADYMRMEGLRLNIKALSSVNIAGIKNKEANFVSVSGCNIMVENSGDCLNRYTTGIYNSGKSCRFCNNNSVAINSESSNTNAAYCAGAVDKGRCSVWNGNQLSGRGGCGGFRCAGSNCTVCSSIISASCGQVPAVFAGDNNLVMGVTVKLEE